VDFKDYYAILGIPRDADQAAIKKAYRALARKFHPDVNPGDAAAEERFKAAAEAYEVLGDPEKRAKYDRLGSAYRAHERAGAGGFDWRDWSTGAPSGARPGPSGAHYRTVTPEELDGLFGEGGGFSDFFESLFGGRMRPGAAGPGAVRPSPVRRGGNLEHPVRVTLAEAFHGTQRMLQIDGRRGEVTIPPGVRTGSKVRVRGFGQPGQGGGGAGDLMLVVEVAAHPVFERHGDNLHVEVPVDIYTLLLGGEATVPTLDGRLKLTVPPGTDAGRRFRLRGKGMPKLGNPSERGDLIATVEAELPESLSDEERELFERLRELRERNGDAAD